MGFEKPDLTIVVLDATALERNMNLPLQVMELTEKVIQLLKYLQETKLEYHFF